MLTLKCLYSLLWARSSLGCHGAMPHLLLLHCFDGNGCIMSAARWCGLGLYVVTGVFLCALFANTLFLN